MIATALLVLSTALQGAAAVLALRLIRVSGRSAAWIFLAAAFSLRTARLALDIYLTFAGGHEPKVVEESLALLVSALALAGVWRIAPIFSHWQALIRHEAEARRREEAERIRLRTVLEALPVGVFILDREGGIVETNGMAVRIWGGITPPARGIRDYGQYRGWWADTGRPLAPEEWGAARAITRGESSLGEMIDILRFDGSCGTILNSAVPLLDPDGRIAGGVVVVQDVTGQRQLEKERGKALEELKAANDSLRMQAALIDASPDLLAILDREYRYLLANRAYSRFHRIDPRRLVGCTVPEFLGPERFEQMIRPHLERAFAGEEVRYELWFDYAAAGRRYMEVRYFPIRLNGGAPCVAAVLRDMTDRRLIEESRDRLFDQVSRQAAEMETTINAIADGVILYDPEGNIRRMNPAAEEIFGYTPQERERPLRERLIRLEAKSQITGERLAPEQLPISRALRGETVQGEVLALHRRDGRTLWLSISAAPIRDGEGKLTGAVSTYADITRLRELQEENESFMHMVAHDLRTPLTVILGHGEMLQPVVREAGLGEIPEINVDSILSAGRQMAGMMEDLVDMARLHGGQMTFRPEAVDLGAFVARLREKSAVAWDVSRILVEIPPHLKPAWIDPKTLERCLTNLLTNALRYSEGSVRVTARQERDRLSVSVIDRGQGIDPEDLGRIFERFYRAKKGKEKKGGIGLGLYITKTLVEAQGGAVSAESEVGRGSTFSLTLPASFCDRPRGSCLG